MTAVEINQLVSQGGALAILCWLTVYTYKSLIPRIVEVFRDQLDREGARCQAELSSVIEVHERSQTQLINELVQMRLAINNLVDTLEDKFVKEAKR